MNKYTNPLQNVKIASPCSADWNEMVGDERQRFCGACKLNVYNLSGMTRQETENLLMNFEDRLCVRFYKRSDGTVLTKDCPVGWQSIKRRMSKTAAAFASLVFGLLSSLGLMTFFNKPAETGTTMGTLAYQPPPESTPKEPHVPLMGGVSIPKPTPKQQDFEMGEITVQVPKTTSKSKNR